MRWSHVWHLGIKEFYSLGRDPVLLVLILYVFTFSIHSQATSIPETLNKAPIAVVDEDRSQLSERILHALYPPYFLPPERIDTATMDARMDRGLDTFALDIPPDFERDVMAGKKPTIQLNVDATRMSQGFTGSGYVQTIVNEEIAAYVARHKAQRFPRQHLRPHRNRDRFFRKVLRPAELFGIRLGENFRRADYDDAQLERIMLEDGVTYHEQVKVELELSSRQSGRPSVHPFMLVVARDTAHAKELHAYLEGEDFFNAAYELRMTGISCFSFLFSIFTDFFNELQLTFFRNKNSSNGGDRFPFVCLADVQEGVSISTVIKTLGG